MTCPQSIWLWRPRGSTPIGPRGQANWETTLNRAGTLTHPLLGFWAGLRHSPLNSVQSFCERNSFANFKAMDWRELLGCSLEPDIGGYHLPAHLAMVQSAGAIFFSFLRMRYLCAPLCHTQHIWISQKGASTRMWVAWFVHLLRLSLWLLLRRHSWNLGLWWSTGLRSWLPWNRNTGNVLGSLPHPQVTAQSNWNTSPCFRKRGLFAYPGASVWEATWGLALVLRLRTDVPSGAPPSLCPSMLPSPTTRDISHRAFFTLVWGLVFTPAAQGTVLDVLVLRASACCCLKKYALPKSWELCFIRQTFWGLKPRRHPLR